MALADIIARIGSDAQTNADAIVASAQQRADEVLAAARAQAERQTQTALAAATVNAQRNADTVVVKARLGSRDSLVAAQRELIDEALAGVASAVGSLPDDAYVAWLAGRIAAVARGGETLAVGAQDQDRADAIVAAVGAVAPGLALVRSDVPAPFPRGARLTGDRVSVDLSVESIIADQRDSLELAISSVLFAREADTQS